MKLEEVAGLAAPTLVLLGDQDMITPEHAAALVRTIPSRNSASCPVRSTVCPWTSRTMSLGW